MALMANGDLYVWGVTWDYSDGGDGYIETPRYMGSGFTQISAGGGFSLALKGTDLYAWGHNYSGILGFEGLSRYDQISTPMLVGTGFTQISAGDNHSLGLKGTDLYAWGG